MAAVDEIRFLITVQSSLSAVVNGTVFRLGIGVFEIIYPVVRQCNRYDLRVVFLVFSDILPADVLRGRKGVCIDVDFIITGDELARFVSFLYGKIIVVLVSFNEGICAVGKMCNVESIFFAFRFKYAVGSFDQRAGRRFGQGRQQGKAVFLWQKVVFFFADRHFDRAVRQSAG